MPNINIYDIDYTRAVVEPDSALLSALVFGFGDPDKAITYAKNADTYGVFECDSQSKFEEVVGLVSNTPISRAFATAAVQDERATGLAKYQTQIGPTFFAENSSKIYTATERNITTNPVDGEGGVPLYGKKILKIVGQENDTYYDLTPVTEETYNSAKTDYLVITYIGNDEADMEHVSAGNQIAYLLLGLGYKVYYKKIDSLADLANSSTYEPLKDRATYNFRFIHSGVYDSAHVDNLSGIYSQIAALAKGVSTAGTGGRGDCIALMDIDENIYATLTDYKLSTIISSIKTETANIPGDKYSAVFTPAATYGDVVDTADKKFGNTELPASFEYLACFARMLDNGYPEWFAAAGETRGVSNYTIKHTTVNLGDLAVNMLEPRKADGTFTCAVNVLANRRGNYTLWGNRTTNALDSEGLTASHFLNIRHLVVSIKKQVYDVCRSLTFDPNSDLLWINFSNAVTPLLDQMKGNQGIRDYLIVRVETDEKAKLKARIRIVPIEAVEDFDIEISLENNLADVSIEE